MKVLVGGKESGKVQVLNSKKVTVIVKLSSSKNTVVTFK
ncbi:hypothetical protein CLFE_026570 [Clostridium felsineum DSM 794]|nr:hypothetical protein CLFE_026570 [Clostridium felsineum DSM 794]